MFEMTSAPGALIGLTAALMASAAPPTALAERPVLIGIGGPDLDACGTYAVVSGLRKGGDGYLSVRIAPGSGSAEKDRIANGTALSVCEDADGWYSVIYRQPGDPAVDCGDTQPVAQMRAYDGPCRYGWVSSRYVTIIAG